MLFTSGLLWLEVQSYSTIVMRFSGYDEHCVRFYGIPLCACEVELEIEFEPVRRTVLERWNVHFVGLLIDIVIASLLLLFMGSIIESLRVDPRK